MKSTRQMFKALLGGGILLLVFALVGQAGAQTWTQLTPTGGPPPARGLPSAVYEAATNRMTVFGGTFGVCFNGSGACFNDVWVLTNADGLGGTPTWTQLSPAGSFPVARGHHSAVYDPGSNRMTMFGGEPNHGFCFGAVNDVWVLSNANGLGTPTWTQLGPSGAPPSARRSHSAVYDAATNRMIVFGGNRGCEIANNQVWVLSNANGLGGTPTWTQLAPGGAAIAARTVHSAVYDAVNNRMIVFGGSTGEFAGSQTLNEVWVLSNANGLGGTPTWTQLSPTGGPPSARVHHSAVYDPASNRMTVFGGGTPTGLANDVWVLENANGLGGTPTWTQITTTGGPPSVRAGHSAVYNQASNRMTVFAGSGAANLNDLWVLTDANGVPPNNPPVAQCQNVTVSTSTGTCSATASVNNNSSDPDGDPITLAQSPSGPYGLGATNVTLTVTDNQGASASCSATVTVVDNQPPAITCPANQVVDSTEPSGAIASFSPTVSDNCGGAIVVSCTPPSGSTFPVGSTSVSCGATDGSGNTSTCSFTVTVLSPSEMTSNLTTAVTVLEFQQAVKLLGNVVSQIKAGNNTAACNQLNAFIKQAQAQSGKQLTVDEANQLIASANLIKAALGCP